MFSIQLFSPTYGGHRATHLSLSQLPHLDSEPQATLSGPTQWKWTIFGTQIFVFSNGIQHLCPLLQILHAKLLRKWFLEVTEKFAWSQQCFTTQKHVQKKYCKRLSTQPVRKGTICTSRTVFSRIYSKCCGCLVHTSPLKKITVDTMPNRSLDSPPLFWCKSCCDMVYLLKSRSAF